MRRFSLACCAFVLAALPASAAENADAARRIRLARADRVGAMIPLLRPLHEPLGAPRAGEWLYAHPERGQTFREYVETAQNLPTAARDTVYMQPLGRFNEERMRILRLAAEFLCLYFHLRVEIQDARPMAAVPRSKQRVNTASGVPQLDIAWVLGGFLREDFPDNAAARIAVTSADLERPRGRNLMSVFGMAYLYHRTAVASVYRMGDPSGGRLAFRRCLRRCLKLVTHETGHALSIRHCKRTACNMNGRNSLLEMDQKPLWLCPDCAAKVCWASDVDPVRRFERLRNFCGVHGLDEEERFYRRAIDRLARFHAEADVGRTARSTSVRLVPWAFLRRREER